MAIGTLGGETIATRREVGKGAVIWLPTPLGLGSWLNQAGPLASYLQQVLPTGKFRFAGVQPDCLLASYGEPRVVFDDGYEWFEREAELPCDPSRWT